MNGTSRQVIRTESFFSVCLEQNGRIQSRLMFVEVKSFFVWRYVQNNLLNKKNSVYFDGTIVYS